MNIECYWQSENAVSKKSCDLAGGASFPVDFLQCRCFKHNKIIESNRVQTKTFTWLLAKTDDINYLSLSSTSIS